MSKPLVVTPPAGDEIAEACAWYESCAPRIAPKFVAELRSVFNAIRERPESFAKLERSYRVALLKRFPYYVVFRELESEMEVVAVSHGRRRPRYWKSRRND